MVFVDFTRDSIYAHISLLSEDAAALWGRMTPQQMIEHLIYTIRLSIGEIERMSDTSPENLDKSKQFLMSNRPMPREFRNPFYTKEDLMYEFDSLDDAKDALLEYYDKFEAYYDENPEAQHFHPIFGYLNGSEWIWLHRKHNTHHFEQFTLLKE